MGMENVDVVAPNSMEVLVNPKENDFGMEVPEDLYKEVLDSNDEEEVDEIYDEENVSFVRMVDDEDLYVVLGIDNQVI